MSAVSWNKEHVRTTYTSFLRETTDHNTNKEDKKHCINLFFFASSLHWYIYVVVWFLRAFSSTTFFFITSKRWEICGTWLCDIRYKHKQTINFRYKNGVKICWTEIKWSSNEWNQSDSFLSDFNAVITWIYFWLIELQEFFRNKYCTWYKNNSYQLH